MAKYYDKYSDKIVGISNDEARKFTRECICTAIVKLMKEKEFSKITVTDICEKAGVSRAGFYRNFKDKEAVLEDILATANVYSANSLKFMATSQKGDVNFWLETIRSICNRERGFAAVMEILETGQGEVLIRFINKLAERELSLGEEEKVSLMAAYFWAGALVNLFTYWLKTGQKETPEELTEYILNAQNFR